ncbi:hypothetical protein ABFX02_07G087800 [Erythranthe guttata]
MSRVYDNWEKLVGAVLKRQLLRELALCESFNSSTTSDFSLDSSFQDFVAFSSTNQSQRDAQPIPFKDLKKATKNFRFDFHLGEEGIGTVYKGWLNEHTLTAAKPGNGMAVAVKKWDPSSSHEWLKELTYLNLFRHPNLVKLIGYCSEGDNLLLVYELMSKGSLENHLFRRNLSLPWATRIKVAKGAARGLSFLHGLEIPVIHRDFKTSKILLDGEFNAKLCGFDLARDGPTGDMTHVTTRVLGTYGYAAPEYLRTGHLTVKCDVFSFGVVLLEFLCGRRAIEKTKVVNEKYLVEWAKPYIVNKRMILRVVDMDLKGQYSEDEACIIAILALQCLNEDPEQRPTMDEVVIALDQLSCT